MGRGTVRAVRGAGRLVLASGLLVRGRAILRWRLVVVDLASAALGLAIGDIVTARDGDTEGVLLTGVATVARGGAVAK